MTKGSAWTRSPKTKTAIRGDNGDRVTLMHQKSGWVVLTGTGIHSLDSSASLDLEAIIEMVDAMFPPDGWEVTAGEGGLPVLWSRPGWTCVKTDSGEWSIRRPKAGEKEQLPTPKTFRSADRARQWVEVRLDRTEGSVRGPRPRADQRAVKHFPDVRVTEAERAQALKLAERLGVSFSDLARAAIKFLDGATAEGGPVTHDRTGAHGELRFISKA